MRFSRVLLTVFISVLFLSSAIGVVLAGPAGPSETPAIGPQPSDDPFGYARLFRERLAAIGQITPEEFLKRYPAPQTLPSLTVDPTRARYWVLFEADPATDREKAMHHHAGTPVDFRLNRDELNGIHRNGFVVSERLGARSFGEVFYWIYSRDLPVFISCDAILHAWHRSYDSMLEELEVAVFAPSLEKILTGMAEALSKAKERYGHSQAPSLADADLFLAVGRSLLEGQSVPCAFDQSARRDSVLAAVAAMRIETLKLFGRSRQEDFSQFKPRGHYTDTESLGRYFRAMMWCGRIDLRVAGSAKESSPRELAAALILRDLLLRSGQLDEWRRFDSLIQRFVGRTDSMTFDQLGEVLKESGRRFPEGFSDRDALEELQKRILQSGIGRQAIRSQLYESSPFGPDQAELPASFTVMGQRFTPDSWALGKVVADDILWNGVKVQRRVPTALDVAFAVLGNNQAAPTLVDEIKNQNGMPFRDGLDYQHNLAAAREVFDAQSADSWNENLYSMWIACLRELSAPTTDPRYPAVMRTRAWAEKSINTQLASWTELRHDSILYAKQSVGAMATCDYPAGYVEPRPEFWRDFQHMAEKASNLIGRIPSSLPTGQGDIREPKGGEPMDSTQLVVRMEKRRGEFFGNFARQVSILADISEKELAREDLTADEVTFLKGVVEMRSVGCGESAYDGWYPSLFYKGGSDCARYDALVADVHTDPPADILGDPGCILEEGTGRVDLLMGAFDCGSDAAIYAGPVLSYYEFKSVTGTRLSDPEWQETLSKGAAPTRPDWVRSYLIPGTPSPGR